MAGHKRPQGLPVCPVKTAPPVVTSENDNPRVVPFDFSLTRGNWRWQNPNFLEPPRPAELDVLDTSSFITTEPAESMVSEEYARRLGVPGKGGAFEDSSDTSSVRSTGSSASSTATLRRSISEVLSITSKPLATLFSTHRENVAVITDTALRHGLHAGVVYSPSRHPPGVKSEEHDGSLSRSARLGRQDSFLVVMGRDAGAVALTMLGLSMGGAQGQVVQDISNERDDGKASIGIRAIQITFLNIIFVGAVGGLVVFFGLSIM